MARSRTFGNGLGLDLHIRTEIKLNWSFISNVAVRIGGDIFEASAKDGASYYNGVQMTLSEFPFIMEGKYVVSKTESVQQVSADKGNGWFPWTRAHRRLRTSRRPRPFRREFSPAPRHPANTLRNRGRGPLQSAFWR